ncbi:MAG: HigA family addiction module antitoxin [Cyanobacteriota bacterium]
MIDFKIDYEPIHPGEILKEEFIDELGITQTQVAKDLGVTFAAINEIINGKRGISIEMAFKLAKYFDMTPNFWINLQKQYEAYLFIYNEKTNHKLDKVKKLVRI